MAKPSPRNIATTIRMSATDFSVTCTDRDTGETYTLDLADTAEDRVKQANGYQKHQVARLLCDLHGIRNGKPEVRKDHKVGRSRSKRVEVSIPASTIPVYPEARLAV